MYKVGQKENWVGREKEGEKGKEKDADPEEGTREQDSAETAEGVVSGKKQKMDFGPLAPKI